MIPAVKGIITSKLLLAACLPFALSLSCTQALSCTIFTVTSDNSVFFGSNEDSGLEGTFITFVPSSGFKYGHPYYGEKHGYVYFSYDENDHPWDGATLGGMNSAGLCFDENWVPAKTISARPERPAFPEGSFYNYFYMFEYFATVAEIENFFTTFGTSYSYNMSLQAHWADATGDAAIASVGPDGDWAFTRREENVSFLISTNWNRAFPMESEPDVASSRERYNISWAMLENITQGGNPTVNNCRDILDAVHFEGFTQYSNVFDLANRDIYLYYYHNFEKVRKFSLEEELAKGYRRYRIADLFAEPGTSWASQLPSSEVSSSKAFSSSSASSAGFGILVTAIYFAFTGIGIKTGRYLKKRKGCKLIRQLPLQE